MTRRHASLVLLGLTGLLVLPCLLSFLVHGWQSAIDYLANDAFFYLAVVKNSESPWMTTYDGELPTNGYHPLWQHLLFHLVRGTGVGLGAPQILLIYGASILLLAAAVLIAAVALRRLGLRPIYLVLALFPGAFAVLTFWTGTSGGYLWTFLNGMETPLNLLLWSILLLLLSRYFSQPSKELAPVQWLAIGVVATLITLSRLDDIFVFAPLFGLIFLDFLTNRKPSRLLSSGFALGIVPLVVIGAYLYHNHLTYQSALPISGASKGSELALVRNVGALVNTFIPLSLLSDRFASIPWSGGSAIRALQMFLPLIPALWALWHGLRKRSLTPLSSLLLLFGGYVVLKNGYNIVNVRTFHQGSWYFPVSILSLNVVVAFWAQRKVEAASPRTRRRVQYGIITLGIASACGFAALRGHDRAHESREVLEHREQIMAALRSTEKEPLILDFTDGVLAYCLDFPCMSGMGFCLDKEAHLQKLEGDLLQVAHDRGYDLFTSIGYSHMPDDPPPPGTELREHWKESFLFRDQDLDEWSITEVDDFQAGDRHVHVLRIRPVDPEAPGSPTQP